MAPYFTQDSDFQPIITYIDTDLCEDISDATNIRMLFDTYEGIESCSFYERLGIC